MYVLPHTSIGGLVVAMLPGIFFCFRHQYIDWSILVEIHIKLT